MRMVYTIGGNILNRSVFRNIFTSILLILWAVLLFFRHIACFDVFDTNEWRLYIFAGLFAFLEYSLLYAAKKCTPHKMVFSSSCVTYTAMAFIQLLLLFLSLGCDPSPLGLIFLCLGLNILGCVLSLVWRSRIPDNRAQGS